MHGSDPVNPFTIIFGFALAAGYIAAYFAPRIIAARRHRVSTGAIAVTNLLLGWTIIGWIAALIWACSGHRGTARQAI